MTDFDKLKQKKKQRSKLYNNMQKSSSNNPWIEQLHCKFWGRYDEPWYI